MKKFSRILCIALSAMLMFASFSLFACKPKEPSVPSSNTAKVTFRTGTGANDIFKTVEVEKGTPVEQPDSSSITNFSHWYLAADDKTVPYNFTAPVNGNITLMAYKTTGETATVTYKVEGNTVLQVRVDKETIVKAPKNHVPTQQGKLFEYWQTNASVEYDFSAQVTADIVLNAHFVNAYDITFDAKGGTPTPSMQTVKHDGTVSKPTTNPKLTNYVFRYWYKGTDSTEPYNFSTPVTDSFTLSASYADSSAFNNDGVVVMATGELDGVFNPFFSTSAYDGDVHGQTQIGLLSADEYGNVDAGEHLPTVALDYDHKTYIKKTATSEPIIDPSNTVINQQLSANDKKDSNKFYTEYKFLIKNGIKFSDGNDLTIKDVLFNLYVYLDPMYSGSSTIYSTNIVGLRRYRAQNPSLGDAPDSNATNNDLQYITNANIRRDNIALYFSNSTTNREAFRNLYKGSSTEAQIISDVAYLRGLFWQEVQSDWNYAAGLTLTEYETAQGKKQYLSGYDDYEFVHAWEVFAFNNKLITAQYDEDGKVKVDNASGKKLIDYSGVENYWKNRDDLTRIVFNSKLGVLDATEIGNYDVTVHGGTPSTLTDVNGKEYIQYENDVAGLVDDYGYIVDKAGVRKYFDEQGNPNGSLKYPQIDLVETSSGSYVSKFSLTDTTGKTIEKAVGESDADYNTRRQYFESNPNSFYSRIWNTSNNVYFGVAEVLYGWASGTNAVNDWALNEKSAAMDKIIEQNQGKPVPFIDGITVYKTREFEGKKAGVLTLNEDHYVLNIKILGVDPKAIWNFAFNVAPMHYYSTVANKGTNWNNNDHGFLNFNYEGVDGYTTAKPINMGFININGESYFKEILNGSVTKLPMGAGVFKASDSNDSNHDTTALPNVNNFVRDGRVNLTRNNFFETTGKEVTNAKFKSLKFMVLDSSKVMGALASGTLQYAEVNALESNINMATSNGLAYQDLPNNGYGYVGVNAEHVKNLYVRRAIMHSLDTQLVASYYGSMAKIIYRSLPMDSWAYPEKAKTAEGDAYPYLDVGDSISNTVTYINNMLDEAGYDNREGGVRYKILDDGTKDRLEYTFTIAGSDINHPAFGMFQNAKKILDAAGFKITVFCDQQALSKLSGGLLQVWAAAWGATIDPDMFQVYHRDSTAQSVNNWGYRHLLRNGSAEEQQILKNLAEAIDGGRSVIEQNLRKDYYEVALDLVMDLAIEYPTYQRQNLIVFDDTVIDRSSFNETITAYAGLIYKIWELRVLA